MKAITYNTAVKKANLEWNRYGIFDGNTWCSPAKDDNILINHETGDCYLATWKELFNPDPPMNICQRMAIVLLVLSVSLFLLMAFCFLLY